MCEKGWMQMQMQRKRQRQVTPHPGEVRRIQMIGPHESAQVSIEAFYTRVPQAERRWYAVQGRPLSSAFVIVSARDPNSY